TSPMSRQKIDAPPGHDPADERVRRKPERCLNAFLRHIGEPFHVIKAAAADNSNRGFTHESAIEAKALQQRKAKCRNLILKDILVRHGEKGRRRYCSRQNCHSERDRGMGPLGKPQYKRAGRRPRVWARNEPISNYSSEAK